ncbi:MAG: nuclear transport factor 2 family protein [Ignavibacteria bacterium]
MSFIEKINDQDINGIIQLLSDDHKFIDSMGIVVNGKKEMKNAWKLYFKWFPDYEIIIKNTLMTDDSVGIFGIAKGTFDTDELTPSDKFEIPAAWRAKVKDNLITEWQVFADNEVVRDIIKSNGMKSMIKEKVKFLHSLRD